MGEKRRDGELKKDHALSKKRMAGKVGKGSTSIAATEDAAPAPMVLKLRLFVGGLGPTVGASDLQQRFAPLGTVHRIDLVEGKKGWDEEEALQRGFAYVDFEASSEASLRKLFSAYNGCKWKGGTLRVEKAKENYMDRLRREWAKAEAEAAVKARIAEKAAANDQCQSRHMYSSKSEDVSGSPESSRAGFVEVLGEDGDGIPVDADEIATQIEKERKKQLNLLTKLFPEDNDAGDEEEKVIEIAKLRAFPMPTDVNAKKRKHALENPSVPVASSSVQPVEEDCRGASMLKSSTHESGALDLNDKQKSKNRRVKFSEEDDERPIVSLHDEKVTMTSKHKDSSDAARGVRSILKKTQEDSRKVDVDRAGDGNVEERDEEEEEDEEYYVSSRSPSPEGGLSDESKWERLFKYAGLKKGPAVTKSSDVASTTLDSGFAVWTGISLDDDHAEPAVAEDEFLHRDAVKDDGLFSGVLSEPEDEKTELTQENTLEVNATVSSVSKKNKSLFKATQQDGVGSDGIFSGVLSDPGEDTESPQPSVFGSKVQDSVTLKKSKNLREEAEICSDSPPDQGDDSSDFEDGNKDLQDTQSDSSSDSEMDEDEDEGEDMEDFVDAASARKSLTPTPLSEVTTANKWAKMFKSATSVAEPAEGVFSGSLDEADVLVQPRAAVKVERMFESAAANNIESAGEAPKVLDLQVASALMEDANRRSPQENASTRSDDTPNHDVAKSEKSDTTDASEVEEECADDQQTGAMSGNLLARFNLERDEPQTTGAKSCEDLQPAGFDPGNERDRDELGLSSFIAPPGGQNTVDENTKWIQRATWKSLMGADGRATFSLKQLTGESETTKATDVKTTANKAVPEQSFNAFSFNFARNPPEASESKPKAFNPDRAEKKSESVSAENAKPAKVLDDEAGCSFMKSADAEKEWRASKSELRIDSKAKHKAAVRKMKKMKASVGAR